MQDHSTYIQRSSLKHWLCLGLTVLAIGCGGKYEAKVIGTVTLDSERLELGTVSFHPASGGAVAYSRIQSDGSYSLKTGQSGGLKPGLYQVTVVATEPVPEDLPSNVAPPIGRLMTPRKYSRSSTTDLEFNVDAGSNEIDLALESD